MRFDNDAEIKTFNSRTAGIERVWLTGIMLVTTRDGDDGSISSADIEALIDDLLH